MQRVLVNRGFSLAVWVPLPDKPSRRHAETCGEAEPTQGWRNPGPVA
jgi:hypothetical protein